MDRALLERMVGAAVLLILLVVVAPAMLEGPSDAPPEEVELIPGPNSTRVETIVLDVAPGSELSEPSLPEPEVARSPEPVASPEPKPAPVVKAAPAAKSVVAAKPKPVVKSAPKPAVQSPATGSYIVQLGIFSSSENAEKFATRIRSRGFSVRQSTVSSSSGAMHRVYVGPRQTRAEADELAAVMANSGYKGIVTSLEEGA